MQSFLASALFAIATFGLASAAPATTPDLVPPTCAATAVWDVSLACCQPTSCPNGGRATISQTGAKSCQCDSTKGLYWNPYTNECRNRIADSTSATAPKAPICRAGYTWNQQSRWCVKNA